MTLTRRTVLKTGAAALAAPALVGVSQGVAQAQEKQWRHGLSLFGDLKYPAGFKRFEYVNPGAPKGGIVRQATIGTFDNLNMVVSGVKGNLAAAVELIYDRLLAFAFDEITTGYGLVAEAVSHPADFSQVTYRLRGGPRWHDGKPLTVDDVIFSLEALKKNSPFYAAYYRHVVKAEKTGDRDVTFTFDGPGNRELPLIVGELRIMPKHWWEGADSSGRKRDIGATTLEPPLGSGPYRVKEFVPGRFISLERVADYWGKDLPVSLGQNNFDQIRYEYFRDSTVALEAFKGDQSDWRTENSAKNWATAYDFPAVAEKRVVLEEFQILSSGGMQAFAFNIRRAKFSDPRVRRAFNFAFDFEEMNKQIFFNKYQRITSYFERTELASSGLPQGRELEILETVRDKVPPEVFTTPYTNPAAGNPETVRNNLREAIRLLKEAGYEIRNQKLVNGKSGEAFTVEFLVDDPAAERFVLFYKPSLERIGITVTVRTVDSAQYENRLRSRDYDIIVANWGQSLSPGNEQRSMWGSDAADQPGSQNYVGIKNPAIDALIDRVIFTKDRADLVAAIKALDRVLLWNHYVVPNWTYPKLRTARWDRFGHPDILPKYVTPGFPTVWWWDAEKAAKVPVRS